MSATLADRFERALHEILGRVCISEGGVAVAYSGGLDSSVLLHLVNAYARQRQLRVYAFHVHHGLSPNADAWLRYCQHECERLSMPFAASRVTIDIRSPFGTEQAARSKRYEALGELCRQHQVKVLLTAHHENDQVETVLLQMLRGCGVAGIGGMEEMCLAPRLLGDAQISLVRPLLGVARAELEHFASVHAICHIDDESNADTRYTRNALRHDVLPVLAECFPGFEQRISRLGEHARAAQRLLNVLAEQDLAACREGDRLRLDQMRRLDEDRVNNLLRYWFALHHLRMPSSAWLTELRVQLFSCDADARIRVTHPECEVRRYRNRMLLVRRGAASQAPAQHFFWRGERMIEFADWRGSVEFLQAEEGVDVDWLQGRELVLDVRRSSELFKPSAKRPSRSLKHHFQAAGIPEWERDRLPVIRSYGKLLFVAGLGWNWREVSVCAGGVHLLWRPKNGSEEKFSLFESACIQR